MLAMADRVALVDVRILVTAILIQREVGGNLAEVLDNTGRHHPRAVHDPAAAPGVHRAGPHSGYVLAVLPIVVGFIIYLLNPEYMRLLFTRSGRHAVARWSPRPPDPRIPLDPEASSTSRSEDRPWCSLIVACVALSVTFVFLFIVEMLPGRSAALSQRLAELEQSGAGPAEILLRQPAAGPQRPLQVDSGGLGERLEGKRTDNADTKRFLVPGRLSPADVACRTTGAPASC